MKKVLIITYYWPPAGGPGVQRVLKFAKYFPEFGWQPIILTVQNGEYPAYDQSLFSDIPKECKVYKTPAVEPFALYKKFTGMSADEAIPVATLTEKKTNWKKKLAHWIRLNIFIPDAKIGWIPYAVKAGKHIIRNEKPDIIFSSSPPPTVHLIARSLARWSRIKWVADFRDPWTEIHYYEKQSRNIISKRIDEYFEKKVLREAKKITSISSGYISEDFVKKESADKYKVIHNGFDEEDFKKIFCTKHGVIFEILHLGSIGKERNPKKFLRAVADLIKNNNLKLDNISITLIGDTEEVVKSTIKKYDLESITNYLHYMPHNVALKKASQADVLLLLITNSKRNDRIIPGKTFEYMRLNKPIIALGPTSGGVSDLLLKYSGVSAISYSDYDTQYSLLEDLYLKWKKDKLGLKILNPEISKFSRKNLTKELSLIFDKLTTD